MTADIQRRVPALAPAPMGRASRWVLALLMPIGPAAVAVLRYVLPSYSESTSTGMVAAAAAHPGAQNLVLWLGFLAILTLVPGVLAAAQLTRAAAPRLTGWAVALIVPAYLSMSGLLFGDQLLWSGNEAGVAPQTIAAVLDAAHPTVLISIGVFVVGHVVGTVLLGIAFLRTRRIPVWAAVALIVSQPLHFVATVFLGSPTLDLIGWSATAVAMGLAARVLLRGNPA